MKKSIVIVGGGFAGLSTLRIFQLYGFEATLFEKEPEVGGVWASSRRYPGLTTQNTKDTYYLSELKMDKSYPEWPSGEQVQKYLEKYIDTVGIRNLIKLNTTVEKTYFENNKWAVTYNQQGKQHTAHFDYLIVANGIFSEPFIPNYPGLEEFKSGGGKIYHNSTFNEKDWTKGKTIIIVGYGKSALDLAVVASDVAKATHVVARHVIWKAPKKFLGVLNMKYILLTRLGENLAEYIRPRDFAKFLHGTGKFMRNLLVNTVEKIVTKQFNLKKIKLHPGNSFLTITRANVSLASDGFFKKVEDGKIVVHREEEIKSMDANKNIKLSNGKTIKADIIICGTGWKQEVPFMDPNIMKEVLDENGDYRLYKNQLPLGNTLNLAFNGYNSSFYSPLSSEIGALWLAEYFTGGLKLPNVATMKTETDKQLAWSRKRTEGKNSKGTNIIPFTMNHIDELLDDIGYNVSGFKKFMQWNVPASPGDYKAIIYKTLNRFEKERKTNFFK